MVGWMDRQSLSTSTASSSGSDHSSSPPLDRDHFAQRSGPGTEPSFKKHEGPKTTLHRPTTELVDPKTCEGAKGKFGTIKSVEPCNSHTAERKFVRTCAIHTNALFDIFLRLNCRFAVFSACSKLFTMSNFPF
ncbi:hypothetical protein RvY_18213-1 [Ramazzottius varieornatus]|uniref:Uncharacterized protein n=1 Tax=Ramazzottius varieornatus TaxID=947166 RepID=A0A1D1W4Y2_RAMVA|nr:hypothetical protein RvY_18213-1 [Ramazzottius varieornatus]